MTEGMAMRRCSIDRLMMMMLPICHSGDETKENNMNGGDGDGHAFMTCYFDLIRGGLDRWKSQVL